MWAGPPLKSHPSRIPNRRVILTRRVRISVVAFRISSGLQAAVPPTQEKGLQPRAFLHRSFTHTRLKAVMPEDSKLTIETSGESSFGPCDCCGQMTSRVWGFVYDRDAATAAYYVEWTPGHEVTSAIFDLIIGAWGENTNASDRQAVSLEFRKLESGPAFMVIDATCRAVSGNSLVSRALSREEVIGTATAAHVFSICDTVYLEDPRLSLLRP